MKTFTDEKTIRLDLQFFAEDDNGAQGAAADDGANEGHSDEGADDAAATGKVKDEQVKSKVVTMTQDELDALIGREKGRVKGKYADYDDLKAKLSEYETQKDEKERAEMTELEQLRKDLETKDTAEQQLSQQLAQIQSERAQDKIAGEFARIAKENDIEYVDAAFKLADDDAFSLGEDGQVIGVVEQVEKLIAANPFLLGKKTQQAIGDSHNGGRGEVDSKTSSQRLQDAADKAKKTGLPKDRAEYAQLKRTLK